MFYNTFRNRKFSTLAEPTSLTRFSSSADKNFPSGLFRGTRSHKSRPGTNNASRQQREGRYNAFTPPHNHTLNAKIFTRAYCRSKTFRISLGRFLFCWFIRSLFVANRTRDRRIRVLFGYFLIFVNGPNKLRATATTVSRALWRSHYTFG